jgi:hypothetical protein
MPTMQQRQEPVVPTTVLTALLIPLHVAPTHIMPHLIMLELTNATLAHQATLHLEYLVG